MALIESKDLKEQFQALRGYTLPVCTVIQMIDEAPTAFDLEKVVEQLEDEKKYREISRERMYISEKNRVKHDSAVKAYERAIEIVKGGGVCQNK